MRVSDVQADPLATLIPARSSSPTSASPVTPSQVKRHDVGEPVDGVAGHLDAGDPPRDLDSDAIDEVSQPLVLGLD